MQHSKKKKRKTVDHFTKCTIFIMLPQIPSSWSHFLEFFYLISVQPLSSSVTTWSRRGITISNLGPRFPVLITRSTLLLTWTTLEFYLKIGVQAWGRGRKAAHGSFRIRDQTQLFVVPLRTGIPEKVKQYFLIFCKTSTKFLKLANLTLPAPHILLLSPKSSKKTMHHHTSVFRRCCHFSIWTLIFFLPNKSSSTTKAKSLFALYSGLFGRLGKNFTLSWLLLAWRSFIFLGSPIPL